MAMPEVSSSTLTPSSEPEDEIFLEGPRSRLAEFFTLLRVMRDFLRGFRTLHFEALTLIQTGKIKNFPIVIMGTDYWKELLYFIDKMAQRGMIAARDLSLIYATDSVDEAMEHIRTKAVEPFGLKRVARPRRPVPLLGERGLSSGR